MLYRSIVLAAIVGAAATALAAATPWHELESRNYDFEQYVTEFQKNYDAKEFEMRKANFDRVLAHVTAHNRDTTKTWKMGVNHMSDWTDKERQSLLGYNRDLGYAMTGDGRRDEAEEARKMATLDLPASVDWRTKGVVTPVKNQADCGSCWTFATAETVESHYAIKYGANAMEELSEQQVASCSPNPKDCGGTGGCAGGTAEVGFAGITKAGGLASEWLYPYTSATGKNSDCMAQNVKKSAMVSGYKKLGVNSASDLMDTVANVGPVAISVAAMSWSHYETGVYDGCNKTDPILDHAVQLVGYGTDSDGGDYWLVRNSWTPTWGEHGYIRLKRQGDAATCGVDTAPGQGSGCTGGPSTVKVCGTCGVLYDNSIPTIA